MFASTISNRPVAVAQPISPQKQMIEFRSIPIKQLYHLSIFMLPNVQFDPDYTALIYYQIIPENGDSNSNYNASGTGSQTNAMVQNDFKLLGFLNATKQSAIFKINPGNINIPALLGVHDEGDIDMDSGISEIDERESVTIVIGISIDPNQAATQQLDCLKVTRDTNQLAPRPAAAPALGQSEILSIATTMSASIDLMIGGPSSR